MTNDQIKSGGELEACPFCGSPALVGQTLDDAWYVMCQEDKCLRIDNYWPTKDEAIAAWNRRTPAKAGEDGDRITDAGKMATPAASDVERLKRAEKALREVALEAHETIPPDGKEAAFMTLHAIGKIVSSYFSTIEEPRG